MSTISASTTSTTAYKVTADTTGALTFQSGSGPTTAMTIDTSQNVGIGTSSPRSLLNPKGSGSTGAVLTLENSSTAVGSGEALGSVEFYSNDASSGGTGVKGKIASIDDSGFGQNYALAFSTGVATGGGNSLTEKMRIDSSGNVGIGTSSPSTRLQVADATSSTRITVDNTSNASAGAGFYMRTYSGGSLVSNATIRTDNTGLFQIYNGTTSDTERIRIDGNGTLGIYASGSTYASQLQNYHASNPYGMLIQYANAAVNNTGNQFLDCYSQSNARVTLRSNGGIANYSANNVNLSDRREKTNFAPAKDYLATICSIPVQTYNYIDQDLENDGGLTLGVVAQDVQEVAPELVMESNWGTEENPKMRLSIYQTDLQYALMKCIQELKAELDAAKADIATLKGAA